MVVSEELESYVRACVNENIAVSEIEKNLREAGWGPEDIKDVFAVVGIETRAKNRKDQQNTAASRPLIHIGAYSLLLLIISGLGYTTFHLSENQLDLRKTNEQEVQDFFSKLAAAKVGFDDTGKMIFPDEQKFSDQRDAYLKSKQSFVEADLRNMQLTLYEKGFPSTTVPILTKGKKRSWWETPTGNYSVLEKFSSAYSSIGNVWMPYSIQFYGNYLIHGWPYYEDGTPVPQGYSGGCIRLATEDARKVFNFVTTGMPILVLEETGGPSLGLLDEHNLVSHPPATQSKSFLVSDLVTGRTLLEKNAEEKLPIASLTKLMTALVSHETIYLGRAITIQDNMLASTLSAFEPKVGERYVGLDLLYPLLMQSSNETADILAGFAGKERFIANMNLKASALSMTNTTFADPSGLSEKNVSSGTDIVKLLQYIYYRRPFIFDITRGVPFDSVGVIRIVGTVDIRELKNYNEFIGDADLVGVKNGQTTAAKETMATVWNIPTKQGNVPVAIVVLGSDNRENDTRLLIEWVRKNYLMSESPDTLVHGRE